MKVLQINLVCNTGSTGKICDSIAKYLLEKGHDVLNCSISGDFIHNYDYRYETDLETLFRKVCFKFWGRKQWQVFLQTKRLLRKISEFHPDIIHIHNIHHNVVDFRLLFKGLGKQKIPIVYTLHDMWAITGGCFSDLLFECSEKTNGCKNCNMLFGVNADCNAKEAEKFLRIKEDLYKKQIKLCFVTVSEWLRQQTNSSIISEYRREVIRNGIDISVFKKSDKQEGILKTLCEGKKIILSCASYWMKRKGLYDLLELGEILGEDYQIVIVGNCNEEVKGAKENILFLDNVSEAEQLAQLYSMADVYVSLSKSETFGLTLAEAACCGVPVIAYDNTGMREVLEIAGGIKIPNGNIQQVAENIKKVCNSKADRSDNETVRDKFSELEMCRKYVELYETMI